MRHTTRFKRQTLVSGQEIEDKISKTTQLLAVGLLFLLLPIRAWSAFFFLTDTQFKNRGFGALIGNITEVNVQSTYESTESGTIQLRILQVVAGTISTQLSLYLIQDPCSRLTSHRTGTTLRRNTLA
jgi:hypothetical protein